MRTTVQMEVPALPTLNEAQTLKLPEKRLAPVTAEYPSDYFAPDTQPEQPALPALPALAQPVRPKVGVVLGSGGIKAFGGIPLFEFLERQGIAIDLLVGCSGGSVVCAGIGAGYSTAEIRTLVSELLDRRLFEQRDYRTLLGIVSPQLGRFDKSSGILKPDGIRRIYQERLKGIRLENMRPRTLIQTTDLLTGEGVVLSQGPAADAVYASGAFFPVLPPLYMDGRWLADGVYSSPIPVLEAVKRNMDVIIAIDFKERVTSEPQGFLDCFHRYTDSAMSTLKRSQMFLAIEMHHYEIITIEVGFDHTVNLRNVEELPAILEAGEQAVAAHQGEILTAIKNFTNAQRREVQQ
jgi:NTE family protein